MPSYYNYVAQSAWYKSQGIYEGSVQVYTGIGIFLGGTIYNMSASSVFFQVFDTASTPVDGSVPVASLLIPAASHIGLDYSSFHGIKFTSGLYFCNSSTQATKTLNGNNLNVVIAYVAGKT